MTDELEKLPKSAELALDEANHLDEKLLRRAFREIRQQERQRVLDEVRDLLDDLEPCDHPIEEYVEYQGFWDKCPRCGETIEADIHSLFVELRRRLGESGLDE